MDAVLLAPRSLYDGEEPGIVWTLWRCWLQSIKSVPDWLEVSAYPVVLNHPVTSNLLTLAWTDLAYSSLDTDCYK